MFKVDLSTEEISKWKDVADNIYFSYDEDRNIYLQQDRFLDKE